MMTLTTIRLRSSPQWEWLGCERFSKATCSRETKSSLSLARVARKLRVRVCADMFVSFLYLWPINTFIRRHVPHSLRSKILGGSSEVPSTYEVTPVITCPVSIENDNRPCSAEDRAKSSADGNKCLCHEDRERQQRKRKVWMVCNSLCDLVAAHHAGGGDQKPRSHCSTYIAKTIPITRATLPCFTPRQNTLHSSRS